jgi:hypothetical protein
MKLTKLALQRISTQQIKLKLGIALGCSEGTVNRYIRQNSDNLTKAAPMEVIRQETGLTDSEILEIEEPVKG